jgi:hypothetical protein
VQAPQDDSAPLALEYLDVYVSAVKDSDPFGFSVQVLSENGTSFCHSFPSHWFIFRINARV